MCGFRVRSFQFFDWRSRAGCTPDEVPRHLRQRTDIRLSSALGGSVSLDDALKSRKFNGSVGASDFDVLGDALAAVHCELSERLYAPIVSGIHQVPDVKRRTRSEVLRNSLAHVVLNYDWAGVGLGGAGNREGCAIVVIAPGLCIYDSVDGDGSAAAATEHADFEKLRPHITRHGLSLLWIDTSSLHATDDVPQVQLAPSLQRLDCKSLDIQELMRGSAGTSSCVSRVLATLYGAAFAQLRLPLALSSTASTIPPMQRLIYFHFECMPQWPPSPIRAPEAVTPPRLVDCKCCCGGLCWLADMPPSSSSSLAAKVVVVGHVELSDTRPDWLGRHHLWSLSADSDVNASISQLFDVPAVFGRVHRTEDIASYGWLVSLGYTDGGYDSDGDAAELIALLIPLDSVRMLIREVVHTCHAFVKAVVQPGCPADVVSSGSGQDVLATALMCYRVSSAVPQTVTFHALHSPSIVTALRSLTLAPGGEPLPEQPALTAAQLQAYVFQCHRDADINTGAFSESELISSEDDVEDNTDESSDGDGSGGSVGSDGFSMPYKPSGRQCLHSQLRCCAEYILYGWLSQALRCRS